MKFNMAHHPSLPPAAQFSSLEVAMSIITTPNAYPKLPALCIIISNDVAIGPGLGGVVAMCSM